MSWHKVWEIQNYVFSDNAWPRGWDLQNSARLSFPVGFMLDGRLSRDSYRRGVLQAVPGHTGFWVGSKLFCCAQVQHSEHKIGFRVYTLSVSVETWAIIRVSTKDWAIVIPPAAWAAVGKRVDFIIWKIEWFPVLYLNSKFHENSLDVKPWKWLFSYKEH